MSTEINKSLFRKVRNKILQTPESYDQTVFGRKSHKAPCGTAACIFGWAAILSDTFDQEYVNHYGKYADGAGIYGGARRALGLTPDEGGIVANYRGAHWPEPYGSNFRAAKTEAEKARAAADYLNYIIRTGKVT